jgi:hypothetical protein
MFLGDSIMQAKDATSSISFQITPKHIRAAKCKNPRECVIAQALRQALPDYLAEIIVGASITKMVMMDGTVLRYYTPENLRAALKSFDKRGIWNLPTGVYKLRVPPPSLRLARMKGEKEMAELRETKARLAQFKERNAGAKQPYRKTNKRVIPRLALRAVK